MPPLLLKNSFRRRLASAAATAVVLLCTACGDGIPKDDDDDDENPPPPPVAALSVFAGDATASGASDATGAAARFNAPRGLAIDSSGNVYVADSGNYTIRKITPAGVVTTVAGAAGDARRVDGNAGSARFTNPAALAVNGVGTMFVADHLDIRSISTTGQVTTPATIPVGNNVQGRALPLVRPGAIAVDANNNLYVSNSYGTRRIAANGTGILEGQNTVDGQFNTSPFEPRGLAVDSSNNVYLFDLEREISRWNPNDNLGSGNLWRLAGAPDVRGAINGTGSAARFEQVVALTVDPQGNIYAADAINNLVRKITPAGVVTTVAGTTRSATLTPGSLPGTLAEVRGIVTDGKGLLYVTSGNAVLRIKLP